MFIYKEDNDGIKNTKLVYSLSDYVVVSGTLENSVWDRFLNAT